MDKIAPYYKAVAGAITGALIPFLTALSVSLEDGTLSAQDWIQAVIAMLVGLVAGGAAVYRVPNIPNEPDPQVTNPIA